MLRPVTTPSEHSSRRCETCSSSWAITARTVINWRGQAVSAVGHLKQLAGLPVLLVWSSETISPHHHRSVANLLTDPDPDLFEIDGADHYPHETSADRLIPLRTNSSNRRHRSGTPNPAGANYLAARRTRST